MEGGDSSGAGAGAGGAGAAAAKRRSDASRSFQYYLDRSTPHATGRWLGTLAAAAIYALRVYMAQGFYIVTYGLGIYLLNLLIGFLSPMVDPELDPSAAAEGPALPTRGSDEFKPFIRRLPEFKFWSDLLSSPPDLHLHLARSVWPSYYLWSAGLIRSGVVLVCIYVLEGGDRIGLASLVLAVMSYL
jgi:hypothetical protein